MVAPQKRYIFKTEDAAMTRKQHYGKWAGYAFCCTLFLLIFTGCGKSSGPDADNPSKEKSSSAATAASKTFVSAHSAPHEGALTPLDKKHSAHVELLAEETSGILTLFVLDKHARDGVRIQQPQISLQLNLKAGETSLTLDAKESFLSGETAGDASQFEVRSPALVGAKKFRGTLDRLAIGEEVYENIPLSYPDGTETSSSVEATSSPATP